MAQFSLLDHLIWISDTCPHGLRKFRDESNLKVRNRRNTGLPDLDDVRVLLYLLKHARKEGKKMVCRLQVPNDIFAFMQDALPEESSVEVASERIEGTARRWLHTRLKRGKRDLPKRQKDKKIRMHIIDQVDWSEDREGKTLVVVFNEGFIASDPEILEKAQHPGETLRALQEQYDVSSSQLN
ncbi:hypothetical protein ACQZV8_16565 [Magnetococcales bacterium HHB-1]